MKTNQTKAALLGGATVEIVEINRIFGPVVVELAAQAGFGCVWIDMEHSHLGLDALSQLILAAQATGVDTVVRIPKGPYNQAIKPLELGAGGLVWPHCKSADEAQAFVQMAKFRPLGLRGLGCGRDSDYGTLDPAEYMGRADAETILGVMIEDAEGVEEVEAIAAVAGIDLLFVGPSDLAHSYGVEREGVPHIDHERVLAAFDRVGAACAASGKAMGTAVGPGESMRRVVAKGTRWLNCCHDMSALTSGLRSARQATLGAKQRTITQQLLALYHRGDLDLGDVSGTAKRHDFSRSMVNHLASFVQHKAKCVEALPEIAPFVERMEQALVDGRRGLALTDAYYVCLAVQSLPKECWLAVLQATFDRWERAATGSFKAFFDEVKEHLQAEPS